MAVEFQFVASAAVPGPAVFEYLVTSLGCERVDSAFARREGMHLTRHINPADEVGELEGDPTLLGPGDLPSVTFRMLNRTDDAVAQRNFLDMFRVVVGFLREHAESAGVLESNGELILLQRLPGSEITFDDDWHSHAPDPSDPALQEISASYAAYQLLQPLL